MTALVLIRRLIWGAAVVGSTLLLIAAVIVWATSFTRILGTTYSGNRTYVLVAQKGLLIANRQRTFESSDSGEVVEVVSAELAQLTGMVTGTARLEVVMVAQIRMAN